MKRVGYLYKEICDLDNCKAAILTASRGKSVNITNLMKRADYLIQYIRSRIMANNLGTLIFESDFEYKVYALAMRDKSSSRVSV